MTRAFNVRYKRRFGNRWYEYYGMYEDKRSAEEDKEMLETKGYHAVVKPVSRYARGEYSPGGWRVFRSIEEGDEE